MKDSDAVAVLKGEQGAHALLAYVLHLKAEAAIIPPPAGALYLSINDFPPNSAYYSKPSLESPPVVLGVGGSGAIAPKHPMTRAEKKAAKKDLAAKNVEVGGLAVGLGLFRFLLQDLKWWDGESVESLALVHRVKCEETVVLKIL